MAEQSRQGDRDRGDADAVRGYQLLWFIGVVRDGLGRYEDKFFASVFLGSGVLFLAMIFVSTAVAAGLVACNAGVTDPSAHAETIQFPRNRGGFPMPLP